jgi:MoxR-like ATPase
MEERTVSIEGETMALPRPFIVLATENPIELEGTFPLPEAQLDRFLFRLGIGYPSLDDEVEMLARHQAGAAVADLLPVVTTEAIVQAAIDIRSIYASDELRTYVSAIVRATRDHDAIELGGSPRASLALFRAAQSRAACQGRGMVTPDDVKALVQPVLAHRVILAPEARLRGRSIDAILAEILETIPVPVEGEIGVAQPAAAR